jgi:hypothetical protein
MTMHIKLLTIYCLIYVGSFSALAADIHYESALQAFQQQKYDASYIHLKSALQANPRNYLQSYLKVKASHVTATMMKLSKNLGRHLNIELI